MANAWLPAGEEEVSVEVLEYYRPGTTEMHIGNVKPDYQNKLKASTSPRTENISAFLSPVSSNLAFFSGI